MSNIFFYFGDILVSGSITKTLCWYYNISEVTSMKKLTYDDVIARMGYFRTKANLSMRETSLQLGYNPQFVSTIENKTIELKVKTLLDFCEVVNITPQDFFYIGQNFNSEDKNVLELYSSLSEDNRQLVLALMKKLK